MMPRFLIPYLKYIPIIKKKRAELSQELEIPLKTPAVSPSDNPPKISRGVRIFNLFGDDKI